MMNALAGAEVAAERGGAGRHEVVGAPTVGRAGIRFATWHDDALASWFPPPMQMSTCGLIRRDIFISWILRYTQPLRDPTS